MARKTFKPKIINGGPQQMIGTPTPMNVVLRKDAEVAARVAYATGRRDAMTTLAEEMRVLSGQFIAVDDMIEAIEKAAVEFNTVIERLEAGSVPEEKTPEQVAAEKARERLILPS